MAITEYASGSATIGTTEWSLTTNTAGPDADATDGVFQCWVDLSALVAGDLFEVIFYEKVRSADTQRKVEEWYFDGAQAEPNWCSPSFILLHGWDFTLRKISGTDRTITWSIRQVA